MKMFQLRVLFLGVAVLCAMGAGVHLLADSEGETITLKGIATWSGTRTEITALLTPAETKRQYTVVYTFKWKGRDQSWTGTLKGSLKKGTVRGTGVTGKRTFIFKMKARKGRLVGQHWETTSGKPKLTGDIGFKVQ